jgi:hypothetical protein
VLIYSTLLSDSQFPTSTGLAISLFSGHCASENRLNLPEFPLA